MDFETTSLSRRRVTRAFKLRGLNLQADALDNIMNVLEKENSSEQESILEALLDELSNNTSSSIVTSSQLSHVVADLSRNSTDVSNEALQLLNAFDTPKLAFDVMRKQFSLDTNHNKRSLFGEAKDKVQMFAQRYALVQQRILRQDLFRPKLVTSDGRSAANNSSNTTHTITPVESLLGKTHGTSFLLGMIVQVEEGKFYLEDATSSVLLDLTTAQVLTDGYMCENCIVLVEGEMMDGVLVVHRMGNPLVETKCESIDSIGLVNTDLFSSMSSLMEVEKLRAQEQVHGSDGMFVILSDVHLDKPVVLEKLDVLFQGFVNMDPLPVFVLMGNFSSTMMADVKTMIGMFEELANLIAKYPRLAQEARFVLVPGNHDVGSIGGILPRPALPKYFTHALRSKVRHMNFATNPCRIRYFSKELVFFRHDITHQLRRNSIVSPRVDANEAQHTVKTILDQGHLCPLSVTPIYWMYDHALRLYPLPDAVVLGDRVDQFYENYADCDAINPGPFSNDFSFVVYRPVASVDEEGNTKSDVEFSQIGDETK